MRGAVAVAGRLRKVAVAPRLEAGRAGAGGLVTHLKGLGIDVDERAIARFRVVS